MAAEELQTLWCALQALGDPVRLRIIQLLRRREQCVCHLTNLLGLSQGTVSYHVGVLKRVGLVEDRRDARWTYYRVVPEAVDSVRRYLDELLDVSQLDPTPNDCDN